MHGRLGFLHEHASLFGNFPLSKCSVPRCIALKGMQQQVWSTQTKGVKPCWNHYQTCTAVFLSLLLQVRAEVKPQHILEISGCRNVCARHAAFHPEVCFQGLQAAWRSLLQACSTLKPHVCVFLSDRHVIPAALTHAQGKKPRVMILLNVKDSLAHRGFRNIYSQMKPFWNVYDDSEKRWGNQ